LIIYSIQALKVFSLKKVSSTLVSPNLTGSPDDPTLSVIGSNYDVQRQKSTFYKIICFHQLQIWRENFLVGYRSQGGLVSKNYFQGFE